MHSGANIKVLNSSVSSFYCSLVIATRAMNSLEILNDKTQDRLYNDKVMH